jgi:alpha-tubulin suppressor-like RCC1 family protein
LGIFLLTEERIYSVCVNATSAYETSIVLYLHTPAVMWHTGKNKFKELIHDKFILGCKIRVTK